MNEKSFWKGGVTGNTEAQRSSEICKTHLQLACLYAGAPIDSP